LAPRWLNDHARPFAPRTLREQDCDVLADLPALRVLGAPLDQVFLMKLHATRVRSADVEDMVALWPRTGFASAAQAVALYYEAYPLAEQDPFLAAYVADLTCAPEDGESAPGSSCMTVGDTPCRRTVRLPTSKADRGVARPVLSGAFWKPRHLRHQRGEGRSPNVRNRTTAAGFTAASSDFRAIMTA